MEEQHTTNYRHKNEYAWGAFLIFVGLVLLMNTLGTLPWSVWGYILRFWPVFLIIGGIGIILEVNKIFSWVFGVFSLLVYALLFLLVIDQYNKDLLPELNISLPSWFTEVGDNFSRNDLGTYMGSEYDLSSQFYSYTDYRFKYDIGASQLNLTDSDDIERFGMQSKYFSNWGEPVIIINEKDDYLELEIGQKTFSGITIRSGVTAPKYDAIVSNDIWIRDLEVNIGAGEANLDFDKVKLDRLLANVGAGKMSIKTTNVLDQSEFELKVGAGEVIMEIPSDVGFEIEYALGLGDMRVDRRSIANIGKSGNMRSENYSSAETRIKIKVDVGLGSFSLNTFNLSDVENV